jgi:hypothetical protein
MNEFKVYTNSNMKIRFEYPASWASRHATSTTTPDFDGATISSPRIDNNIDKGAVIGLSLLPDPLPGSETPDPEAEAIEKDAKTWMKERPCKLGGRDATCLEGVNPIGARLTNYIVKGKGKRFGLHLTVMPAELWPNYEQAFSKVLNTFSFSSDF